MPLPYPMPRVPGYRIDREVGRGGMANVYLATQESLARPVALKVLAPHHMRDPTFAQRFVREGRIAAGRRSRCARRAGVGMTRVSGAT